MTKATIKEKKNGFASTDTVGLSRIFLWLVEKFRRVPGAKWFALIGTIDKTSKCHFILGKERTYTIPESGELYCFTLQLHKKLIN